MDEQILSIERYGGNRENLIQIDLVEQANRKKITPKKIALVASPWVLDDQVEFRSQ